MPPTNRKVGSDGLFGNVFGLVFLFRAIPPAAAVQLLAWQTAVQYLDEVFRSQRSVFTNTRYQVTGLKVGVPT